MGIQVGLQAEQMLLIVPYGIETQTRRVFLRN